MSALKDTIKKIPGVKAVINIKKGRDFSRDRKLFFKNYMYSQPLTKEKIDFELLLEIHKIEKGLACVNPRPFGIDKVKTIIKLLKLNQNNNYSNSFATDLAYNTLIEYKNFYKEKKWVDREEYQLVKEYMAIDHKYNKIPAGAIEITKKDITKYKIDYKKFIMDRKSVRNYSNLPLKKEDIKYAIECAILSPSACNRQMCKIYQISKNKNDIVEHYAQGLGLFDLTNANYFVVTFDLSSCYIIGERNQGYLNAGLFSMNFVNALHSLGIGSCFMQFGNSVKEEIMMKKELDIPDNERIAVIIVAGYYDEVSKIPHSARKSVEDVYVEI